MTEWPEPPMDRSYRYIYEPGKWYVDEYCTECEPGRCIDNIYGPFDTEAEAITCGEARIEGFSMFAFYVHQEPAHA